MRKWVTGVGATLLVSACGIQVPVNGELAGVPAQGTAAADLGGGRFSVSNTRGLNCSGTYDALDSNVTITAPITCNDGRTGNAIISRKSNMVSGTVIVRLNDGAEGRFVFGDLSFSQEFG